jgi:maltose O-acetyltransferase
MRSATELGPRIRTSARLRVVNHGRLVVGERVRFNSTLRTIELAVERGGEMVIGARTFFNSGCTVGASKLVEIGEDCLFGPDCMIMDNDFHHVDPARRHEQPESLPVIIGRNVWLGARVIVLPGTTIGDDSVIAAGSVVRGNVEARSLYGGVPAKRIRGVAPADAVARADSARALEDAAR